MEMFKSNQHVCLQIESHRQRDHEANSNSQVDLEKLDALIICVTTKDYLRIDQVLANVITITTWISNLPNFGSEKLKCVQDTMGNITVWVLSVISSTSFEQQTPTNMGI